MDVRAFPRDSQEHLDENHETTLTPEQITALVEIIVADTRRSRFIDNSTVARTLEAAAQRLKNYN